MHATRGARYLADERGAFERTEPIPLNTQEQDEPKQRRFAVPLIDFLDQRSQSFFVWVAGHGWGGRRPSAA